MAMPDARTLPFYAVCKRGAGSGRALHILGEHGSLRAARVARKEDKRNLSGSTAIYKFTFGLKPEFIEGTVLFPALAV